MKTLFLIFIGFILTVQSASSSPMQNEKVRARISFNFSEDFEHNCYLLARVLTRKRQWVGVDSALIHFYLKSSNGRQLLGSQTTNTQGEIKFPLPEKINRLRDSIHQYIFVASLNDHLIYRDTEAELVITNVAMEMNLLEEDSPKVVQVLVSEIDSAGLRIAKEDIPISILVTRPFSPLPIGNEVTNDVGQIKFEFPTDLPGDQDRMLTIVSFIDDHDEYGSVERRITANWGIPSSYEDHINDRSLWASGANAPISLVLLTNLMILAVWGLIGYTIIKIFQIRRLGKPKASS